MRFNMTLNNISINLLKVSFLLVPLYFNKNVLRFRTSQQALLFFFVILLLWLMALKFLFSPQKGLSIYHAVLPYHKAIISFIFIMIFSLIISPNRWISFQDFLLFLSYFAFYFIVISSVKNKKLFYSIIYIIFFTAFIVSLYTILQYYRWDPFLKEMTQLTSTIGQRNWISNYLAMIFPVVFSYFLLEQTKKNKIIYFILLSILYVTLMICQSRGIWISISLTVILVIYIIIKFKFYEIFKRNRKWLTLLLVTFLIITIIYSTDNPLNKSAITVPQRAMSTFDESDPSINTRLLIWKTAIEMIKDRPIIGWGIGTFKMEYLNYQAEVLKDLPWHLPYYANAHEAHNEYLQLLAEMGIFGFIAFLILFYFFYKKILLALSHENASNREKAILLGMLMGISGFLIHCLFTFPLHVPALGMTFFGIMGLSVAYIGTINIKKRDEQKENSTNSKNNAILVNRKYLLISVLALSIAAFCLLNFLVFKPYYAELLYFQGLRHTVDQEYDLALVKFDQAYRFNPYDGKNLHALGGTYYNLKNYEKAEELLVKAKHYLTDVNTFYNLGLVYSQIDLYIKAEEEYKQAVYLDPKFTKGYHYLGLLYFQQKDYNKAIEQWGKLLEIESDFTNKYVVFNNLGIVYNKKEMPDKALEYFLEALQLVPEGDLIEKEIEEEINKIYKSKLKN